MAIAVMLLGVGLAGPVAAKPPLRDVPEIHDALFSIALADEIRDQCDSIRARTFKAIGQLRRLRARANDLGYSDTEIRAFVESDAEKDRMRAKGQAYFAANGAAYENPETFCALGRAEIAKSSAIGALLKAR